MNEIITGDARELCKEIPDESIDLVFTDPPYLREYLPLYSWLSEECARVLKPGGMLLTYSPQYHLYDVMTRLGEHLTFHWQYITLSNGARRAIRVKKIFAGYKPLLAFSKGLARIHRYSFDVWTGTGKDKRFHKWGQDESTSRYYISTCSLEGDTVWEPFTGGGTVPYVCKQLHRNFIAYEIDPAAADIARKRLETVQPFLFQQEIEQLDLAI